MQNDHEIVPIQEENLSPNGDEHIEEITTEKKSKIRQFGRLMKHAMSTFEESMEGLSIAYSSYIILAYDPKFESQYGYGFVAVGGLTGGITELLHINGALSDKKHHNFRLVKEALAGASVAAIFTEGFLPEEPSTVALGGAVVLLLTTSKALLEVFQQRPFFKKIPGKILEYSVGGVYNLMMGAGIGDYLFSICEGFGAEVHPSIKYGVTAGLSVANLLADMPITKFSKHHDKNAIYKAAHLYRSFLYGSEISLFLVIFLFDMITDIQKSTDIKDPVFYGVVSASLAQGLIVMISKLIHDHQEAHLEEQEAPSDTIIINQHEEVQESRFSIKSLSSCCYNFWHSKDSQEEKLDKFIEANSDKVETPTTGSGYRFLPSWLNNYLSKDKEMQNKSRNVIIEDDEETSLLSNN